MENRTPVQITEDMVLCSDNTLWKLSGRHWIKLPPIPSDEEYEKQVETRTKYFEKQTEWFERRMKEITEKYKND